MTHEMAIAQKDLKQRSLHSNLKTYANHKYVAYFKYQLSI